MPGDSDLKPGDLVDVPWGLDTFPGRVIEAYTSGGVMRVRVEVEIPGRQEPETMVLRAEDIVAESSHDDVARPGGWTHAPQYLRNVLNEIVDAVAEFESPQKYRLTANWTAAGHEYDALLEGPSAVVVIEIKWQLHELRNYINQVSAKVNLAGSFLGEKAAGLLISPNAPRAIVAHPHVGPSKLARQVVFVRWRGESDSAALREAVRMALELASKT